MSLLSSAGPHSPSTVWPLESLFIYGAISVGVRGVKRDTLTRGREPVAASSGGRETEQGTPDSLWTGQYSLPEQCCIRSHQQCCDTIPGSHTASNLTAPPVTPSADTEEEASQALLILNNFPMQAVQAVNSGRVDVPLESLQQVNP